MYECVCVCICVRVSVCLAEKQLYEVHRQERQLELCERRQQYRWSTTSTCCPTRVKDDVYLPRLIHVCYTRLYTSRRSVALR